MIDEVKQHGNKLVDEVKSLWGYHIFKIGIILVIISLLIWEVFVKSATTLVIVEKKTNCMQTNMVFVLAKGVSVNKIRKKNNGG